MENMKKETGTRTVSIGEMESVTGGTAPWEEIRDRIQEKINEVSGDWRKYIPEGMDIETWKKLYEEDPEFWKKYIPDTDWKQFIPKWTW